MPLSTIPDSESLALLRQDPLFADLAGFVLVVAGGQRQHGDEGQQAAAEGAEAHGQVSWCGEMDTPTGAATGQGKRRCKEGQGSFAGICGAVLKSVAKDGRPRDVRDQGRSQRPCKSAAMDDYPFDLRDQGRSQKQKKSPAGVASRGNPAEPVGNGLACGNVSVSSR